MAEFSQNLWGPEQQCFLASCLAGAAVFLFASRVILFLDRHVRSNAADWEFEQKRRLRLRSGSPVYRWTEPLIDELASSRCINWLPLEQIEQSLLRGGDTLPWTHREFAAVRIMESILLLVLLIALSSVVATFGLGLGIGLVFAAFYLQGAVRGLRNNADQRIQQICRRMPYGVDLIALTMKAGAGLREALETVVAESPEHPFSQEFGRVLNEFNRGRTLRDALTDLDLRLRTADLREMVFAIVKSEELGTPLADIFANLAEQMRLKKAQWAEAEVGRSQVRVQGPAVLIMVACMLTILAPFVFQFLRENGVI